MPLQCELMARDSASAVGRGRTVFSDVTTIGDETKMLFLASREDRTLEPSAALADTASSKLRLLRFLVIYREHEQGHP